MTAQSICKQWTDNGDKKRLQYRLPKIKLQDAPFLDKNTFNEILGAAKKGK